MLALSVTVMEVSTRYAVPISVLCTVADAVFLNFAVVAEAVGATMSGDVRGACPEELIFETNTSGYESATTFTTQLLGSKSAVFANAPVV
jgi:hypothetical protein